jgi:hypothetical protein
MRRLMPISLLGVALLVACGQAAVTDDSVTTSSSTTATSQPEPAPTTTEGDVTPPTNDPTEAAIDDLAARLTVPRDQIEVVETRAVTWPDGALGCPEEGMVYTQATVEGTQIVLRVDSRVFAYHAGDDGAPFLCPSDEKDGGYDFVPPPGFDD